MKYTDASDRTEEAAAVIQKASDDFLDGPFRDMSWPKFAAVALDAAGLLAREGCARINGQWWRVDVWESSRIRPLEMKRVATLVPLGDVPPTEEAPPIYPSPSFPADRQFPADPEEGVTTDG